MAYPKSDGDSFLINGGLSPDQGPNELTPDGGDPNPYLHDFTTSDGSGNWIQVVGRWLADQAGSNIHPPGGSNSSNVEGSLDVSDMPYTSDAETYGWLKHGSIEDQLMFLIRNDPDNAQSWLEALMDYRTNQYNINQARQYDKYMQDTRIQRTAKDLEAAGINPILAYQFLNNSNGSSGTAGSTDFNVATNATSRKNALSNVEADNIRSIVTALSAVLGVVGAAMIAAA